MTTIAIIEQPKSAQQRYRAVAGEHHAVGDSMGQALDALNAQLGEPRSTALVVVQPMQPDEFFTATQQQRLEGLMARWRVARDSNSSLTQAEQAELDALIDAEVQAAAQRAAALLRRPTP